MLYDVRAEAATRGEKAVTKPTAYVDDPEHSVRQMTSSEVIGDGSPLRVEEHEGHRVLVADGVILSVAVTDTDPPFGYWTAMLPEGAPRTALLLGLGAGTLAHLLARRFPDIRMVGVDIDSRLIEFARRHFDLALPNLEIVIGDAFSYAAGCRNQFDYVAVDLFCGHAFQRGAVARPFLRRLKTLAEPSGEIAVNLFKDRRSEVYVGRLARVLTIRRVERLVCNVVVHCGAGQ
jgi:spermidine synthase